MHIHTTHRVSTKYAYYLLNISSAPLFLSDISCYQVPELLQRLNKWQNFVQNVNQTDDKKLILLK